MSEMIERVARVLKQEIGRQLNAQPLPGEGNWIVTSNSWNPEGGTLNLSAMARAAITAMRGAIADHMQAAIDGGKAK